MVMVRSPSPGDRTQFLLTPWFEPAHSLVVSYGACLQVFPSILIPSGHGVRQEDGPHPVQTPGEPGCQTLPEPLSGKLFACSLG